MYHNGPETLQRTTRLFVFAYFSGSGSYVLWGHSRYYLLAWSLRDRTPKKQSPQSASLGAMPIPSAGLKRVPSLPSTLAVEFAPKKCKYLNMEV